MSSSRRRKPPNPDGSIGAELALMALLMTIESSRPEGQRLFDDRFSRNLLPVLWRVLLLPGLYHVLIAAVERRSPGTLGSLLCRTRYIDDALVSSLRTGTRQVAVLGAGFDTRPYHIPGIDRIRVFEVDLPAVQYLKWERLQKTFGLVPPHVTLVPANLNERRLAREMKAAGFRPDAKAFFIWEDAMQYHAAAAVESVFDYVSQAADGSRMAFTYIDSEAISGASHTEASQQLTSAARRSGTPRFFGLDPAGLREYLAQRGLLLIEEVGAPDYQGRYLEPLDRRMSIVEGERVVLAQVSGTLREQEVQKDALFKIEKARCLPDPGGSDPQRVRGGRASSHRNANVRRADKRRGLCR